MYRSFLKFTKRVKSSLSSFAVFLFLSFPFATSLLSAPPTFQATGTVVSGTNAITPTWPTHQIGDIALLVVETDNAAVTLTTSAGFIAVANSPQTISGTRLSVFWARATSNSMANPTVADSGNHQIAQIITFRGVISAGNPWDVTAGDTSTSSTNFTIPGATTTLDNTLVVAIVSNGTDTTSPRTSGWTNANLTNLLERTDVNTGANNGGGFGLATGIKATAGNYGNTTGTLATASAQGRISIALKPALPIVSINDAPSVAEGNTLVFPVTLNITPSSNVTVNYTTAPGTATAGSDYTTASGTLTFLANTTTLTQNIIINTINDTVGEFNEILYVNLSGETNATISDNQGEGTILNDDIPTISIADASIAEGDSGTKILSFPITLSVPYNQAISVNFSTNNGTATTANNDYVAVSNGIVSITAGSTTGTANVTINGDIAYEPNETFTVTLSSPTNATIATGTATGTISNDDTIPTLSIANASVVENNSSTTTLNFIITQNKLSAFDTNVSFSTSNGSATAGSDYIAVSNQIVTIPAGSTQVNAPVIINGDTLYESNETFTVTLSSPVNATMANSKATGTIFNDDIAPLFSISDVNLTEGHSGYKDMNFTVTISFDANATVDYMTIDGTATAGSDYNYTHGTLTFVPGGATTQTITVPIVGDRVIENNETFAVLLYNPTYSIISDDIGIGTIINDDFSFCYTNHLSTGFNIVNPFNDVNKSIEIFCYNNRDFIALPIKNDSNNFVFNADTLSSTHYYNEAKNNGSHFQAIEINAYTLDVLLDSSLRTPQTVSSFKTMGSSFSNINLTATPFAIDWDNTTISNCTEAKLRKAYYSQDVKINTLDYDNKAICNIDTMKLKLLPDYRYLEYNGKEVLEPSCKTMSEAVPKSFLNASTIKGHYWISPHSRSRSYNSTTITSDERPIVVYCWYQSDLNWVWTFSLAMDGKVTNKKSDLVSGADTCSEFGLFPFVPNNEKTFERVRKFLYDKKSEWVNYTGTINEKISLFKEGNSYYLSKEKNSIIWPYGSFGVYFKNNGNTPQGWRGSDDTHTGWMSGSPMHNIKTITTDYDRLSNDEGVNTRDYYSHGHYSNTDTSATANQYAYTDTMGAKGWVSILGDLNKTNEWFISRTGAGDNFDNTANYPYYEPNGNYTAEAWLNFLFDSNGRVRHNDDWDANYPYYDYMCMAKDNYDFYTPYDITEGPFTVIEHGQAIYNGRLKSSLNTTITTKIVKEPLHFDLVLWDSSLSRIDKDQNISAGLFLTELIKESHSTTPIPYDRHYFGQINGANPTLTTTNGYLYLDSSKWGGSNTISSAKKQMEFQLKYCNDDRLTEWTQCWTQHGNTATCTSGCNPKDASCICQFAESDIFAVRPDKFDVDVNETAPYKAGKQYKVTFLAKDFVAQGTTDYNGTIPLNDPKEVNANCIKGIYDTNLSALAFTNGSSDDPITHQKITLRYSEVGKVNVKIEETAGLEFAKIDDNDTSWENRRITPYDQNWTYTPDHFEVNASIKDANFTYISADANFTMSLELDLNATAKAETNTTTKNYNTTCYANETNYIISHNDLSDPAPNDLNITPVGNLTRFRFSQTNPITADINGTADLNQSLDFLDFNLSKDIFTTGDKNGTSENIKVKINFDRNASRVVNPFILRIKDVNVTDNNTTIKGARSDTNATTMNRTFYYGRVYSTDYRGPKTGIPTTIRYEVYCKDCNRTTFNINGTQSPTSLSWYQNKLHNSLTDGNVTQFRSVGTTLVKNLNDTASSTAIADGFESDNILTNATAPYTDRIWMIPSEWLIYNAFDPLAAHNDFDVEFIQSGTWAGQGNLGKTVDTNTSVRTNRKMEW